MTTHSDDVHGNHEEALRAAGFGEEFWADLLAQPPLTMLRCRA